MTLMLVILDVLVSALVTLATCIQVLYLESQRLRARDLPSLEFFKETLESRIGLETEKGALVFSLVKHIGLAVVGVLTLAATLPNAEGWEGMAAACLLVMLYAVLGTYLIPQIVYTKSNGIGLLRLVPLFRALALVMRPLTGALAFLHSLFNLGEKQHSAQSLHPRNTLMPLLRQGKKRALSRRATAS